MFDPGNQRTEIMTRAWEWQDVSTDVRGSNVGVRLTRGRKNEFGRVSPTNVSLTLANGGDYNPYNPMSPHYGLIGQNTQCRCLLDDLTFAFTATGSSAWPVAEGGAVAGKGWTLAGSAADYSSSGGKGLMSLASTNVARHSTVASYSISEPVASVIIKPGVVATGASIQMGITVHETTADSDYLITVVQFATDGNVDFIIGERTGGGAATVLTSLSDEFAYDANSEILVEMLVHGSRIIATARDINDSTKSTAAQATITASTLNRAKTGSVGVRAIRLTGNTNGTINVSFDDLKVARARATFELPDLGTVRWGPGGFDVTQPLQGAGLMRRLGTQDALLDSPLTRAHRIAQDPEAFLPGAVSRQMAWWPLEDSVNARVAASGLEGVDPMEGSSAHSYALAGATLEFGAAAPVGSGAASLVDLSGGGALQGKIPRQIIGTHTWFEAVARFNLGTGTAGEVEPFHWFAGPLGDTEYVWRISVSNAIVRFRTYTVSPAATNAEITLATDLYDGQLHHFAVEVNQVASNYDIEFFVDGVSAGTDTWVAAPQLSSNPWRDVIINYSGGTGSDMPAVGQVAVYINDGPVTDTAAAAKAHVDETAAERFGRLLDEEGFVWALRGTSADFARMGPQRIASLLSNLQDCEDTERGIIYEPREFFGLAFRSASDLANQTASLSLGYTSGHIGGELFPQPDESGVTNDVVVSRQNGTQFGTALTSGRRSTQSPPDGIGVYRKSFSTAAEYDGQLPDIAGHLLSVGTHDGPRYSSIQLFLHGRVIAASESLTKAILELDIGDAFAVTDLPSWLPPESLDLLAQGYQEHYSNLSHEMTLNTTPGDPYRFAVRGSSYADRRVRDSLATTLNEALDTTETGVDVAVTGPLWQTGSVDFDIMIGGELMSVSSIAGASSPQTFTVTRSVNGIVKTHAISAEVDVYPPPRRALSGADANTAYTPATGRVVRGLDTPRMAFITGATTGTFTSASFIQDTNPVGVVFTAPATGMVIVHHAGRLSNTDAGGFTLQSFAVREGAVLGTGTSALASSDSRSLLVFGTDVVTLGRSHLVTGLEPGRSYNCTLAHRRVTAGNASIDRRTLLVRPAGTQGGLPGSIIQGEPSAVSDVEDTSDTTTSLTYTTTDMTACGVAFVAPPSGKVLVHAASRMDQSGGNSTFVSFAIREGTTVGSGTSFQAADDTRALKHNQVNQIMGGASFQVSGLTAGANYNVQLEHRVTGGTGTLENRHVIVEPVF